MMLLGDDLDRWIQRPTSPPSDPSEVNMEPKDKLGKWMVLVDNMLLYYHYTDAASATALILRERWT